MRTSRAASLALSPARVATPFIQASVSLIFALVTARPLVAAASRAAVTILVPRIVSALAITPARASLALWTRPILAAPVVFSSTVIAAPVIAFIVASILASARGVRIVAAIISLA
jgi:hypothetical protein